MHGCMDAFKFVYTAYMIGWMHAYMNTCTPTRHQHTKQEEREQQDGIKNNIKSNEMENNQEQQHPV